MANEFQMIKLLIDRVVANGDEGRKRILGSGGQIHDLCYGLLNRLNAGDQEAAMEIAEVFALHEQTDKHFQRQGEGTTDGSKKSHWRNQVFWLQQAVMPLYVMALDDYRPMIEAAQMKLELQKSVAK